MANGGKHNADTRISLLLYRLIRSFHLSEIMELIEKRTWMRDLKEKTSIIMHGVQCL